MKSSKKLENQELKKQKILVSNEVSFRHQYLHPFFKREVWIDRKVSGIRN
jgi:hypothetical protein